MPLGPVVAAALTLALIAPASCSAAAVPSPSGSTVPAPTAILASPAIVVGFLGGRVKKANSIHREVQLAIQLRAGHPAGVYAQVFQNDHGKLALRSILRLLDANHDGVLSLAEKQHARIILYGHSWGASETVALAQQLNRKGIPVLLAVLVDRVAKIGEVNELIPANVAEAVNFYQLDGLLHGNRSIRAADPAATRILGNYRLDYSKTHIDCARFPWYARAFMGPHIEIENDPRVWNRVESLIDSKLPPEKAPATMALIPLSH